MHANDTVIENCRFGTGHGTSIGSLGKATYLKNITVADSSYKGAVQALRIKADTYSSGALWDVAFRNLTMSDSGMTLQVISNYSSGGPSKSTLAMSNIVFSGITSTGAAAAGEILCSSLAPCKNVSLSSVTHPTAPPKGWACENAHGFTNGLVSPPIGSCLAK